MAAAGFNRSGRRESAAPTAVAREIGRKQNEKKRQTEMAKNRRNTGVLCSYGGIGARGGGERVGRRGIGSLRI